MVTPDQVRAALHGVLDPHMRISVVEMGMLRSVDVAEDGDVCVGIAFPCIGCPAWTMIQEDIREAVEALDGVRRARVEVRWDEPWRKTDLAPGVRQRIRSFGYQILPME